MTPSTSTWEIVATRLRPFVRSRLRTESDTDDVMQEILLRIHRGLPTLEDERRIDGWMYRIAANAINDHGRVVRREPIVEPIEPTVEPEEEVDEVHERLTHCVAAFVSNLPSPYREAVTLVEIERLTHREAAEMLGISVSGMKSRVQRGRQKMRAMLDACCSIALDSRNRPMTCDARPNGVLPSCDD